MPAPNPTLLALGGHRGGSSGADSFIPEHTKAAYAQGASAGVTYLVPDVISTKDGVLMVMYGNELSRTSNVADLFPDRMTTKTIDDGDGCGEYEVKDGYFSEDFTWAEIKTLRLHSAQVTGGPFDGLWGFLTFGEMLDYVEELSDLLGWQIGVYPETKLANYFKSIDLPLEEEFVKTLQERGYCDYDKSGFCSSDLANEAVGPVLLQSFSPESLRTLRTLTDMTTVSLISGDDMGLGKIDTADKIADIATYADIISLPTSFSSPTFAAAVTSSKSAGLQVHAWVADVAAPSYATLVDLEIDGLFTNNAAYAQGALAVLELARLEGKEIQGPDIHDNIPDQDNSNEALDGSPFDHAGVIAGVLGAGIGAMFAVVVMAGYFGRGRGRGDGKEEKKKKNGFERVRGEEPRNAWQLRLDGQSMAMDEQDS